MSTIGDRLGRGARSNLGVGISLTPQDIPVGEDLINDEWQHGLFVSESPESIPPDSASSMVDMEVDRADSLVRAPGFTQSDDVSPRNPRYIFQHAAVDYSTELVIVDPPYVGHKSTGVFTFNNLGIAPTSDLGWNAVNVAGTLLFSNGTNATYTRQPGASIVTNISADVVAECFATAFGRVFAGAFTDPITGLQSIGVMWNAASGSLTDWTGIGSGAEDLIANELQADRLVAMIPLGLQTLGILMRKSLWAGYQTGIANRPADFQLRFSSSGCAFAATACSSPAGILYLSDDGVCLYDLNGAQVISTEIAPLLLPLDYVNADQYQAVYLADKRRYILNTPIGIFVYEFPRGNIPGRWFLRSFVAKSLTRFVNQSGDVYWNTVQGTWAAQIKTWAEMIVGEKNAPALLYATYGTLVGYEDPNATDNFGVAQTPRWDTPQSKPHVSDVFDVQLFEVQYRSTADASVSFTTTDTSGNLTNTTTKILPSTGGLRKKVLIFASTHSGMGTLMRVAYNSTAIVAIERIRRVIMAAGPSIGIAI